MLAQYLPLFLFVLGLATPGPHFVSLFACVVDGDMNGDLGGERTGRSGNAQLSGMGSIFLVSQPRRHDKIPTPSKIRAGFSAFASSCISTFCMGWGYGWVVVFLVCISESFRQVPGFGNGRRE